MADTVPYWDSGEFIATSYILGVPHPPGSPLYLIIGRIFSMLPINPDIAFRVNLISPVVLLYCNVFVLIMCKTYLKLPRKVKSTVDAIIVFGSSLIGSLTFAFTDSHWFNAVEAEVYGFSTFFTAIVVWLILLWSEKADNKGNERYILIIAYMIGLATGVHLLNFSATILHSLFTLENLIFLTKGFAITTAITGTVFYVINTGIINGMPKFVDKIGLSAVMFAWILIFGLAIASIFYKKIQYAIGLSAALILIGYSSYAMIFIRSDQKPAINENDPSTVSRAIAYMERKQYGRMFLPRRYTGLPDKHVAVGRPQNGRRIYKQSRAGL